MSRYVVTCQWSDVPHLDQATIDEMLASMPMHQRDARSKGLPSLGAGVIYPVREEEYLVAPFPLPAYWPRVYGMDVGWNRTAVVWGAWDRETDTVYIYSEHYRGQAEPPVHAAAIKARGDWIPGVIDPAANGRNQKDGQRLLELYDDLGLDLTKADNSVESGIYSVWERLSSGRLRVFNTMQNFLDEIRLYRRDEKGRPVKQKDHTLDALRYLIMSGLELAKTQPVKKQFAPPSFVGDATLGY